jgi:YtcA family
VQLSRRSIAYFSGTGIALVTCGCGRAPSFSILGSYFPAWLLCLVAGILLTALTHWLLTRLELAKELIWTILVYPCMTAFFAFTLWLIFFSV